MKNFLLLLLLAFAAFSCRAQAVYQLSVLPVCWNYADNADSTLYAYWLMSSRQEEPRLMSYLNVAGQVVSVAPGSLSPGPCCCDGAGTMPTLTLEVQQDSILVLLADGEPISTDTLPIRGLRDGNGMFSLSNQDSLWRVTRYHIGQGETSGWIKGKGSYVLRDSSSAPFIGEPLFSVYAGGGGASPGFVQIGSGILMPQIRVDADTAANGGQIRIGYGATQASGYQIPVQRPEQVGLSSGRYVPTVFEDGLLAGTRGWLSVDSLGGGNGIYGGSGLAANNAVAKTQNFEFITDDDAEYNIDQFKSGIKFNSFVWDDGSGWGQYPGTLSLWSGNVQNRYSAIKFDGETNVLNIGSRLFGNSFSNIELSPQFLKLQNLNENGNGEFVLTPYDDGMQLSFYTESNDYGKTTYFSANPEEGFNMSQSWSATDNRGMLIASADQAGVYYVDTENGESHYVSASPDGIQISINQDEGVFGQSLISDGNGHVVWGTVSGGGGSGPTYTAGAGIAISGSNVISATDNSATNEIQALSLSGNTLALSNGGGNVDLTANLGLGTATSTTRQITSSIGTPATLPSATTTLAGLMSSADKTKLDGLTPGGTNLSTTNLTQTDANRTYTYTGSLSFLGGNSLLLQSTALNVGRAGQAQTAAIPTLSPQGAGLTTDPNGFIRVVNFDGTLNGTGYRGIGELFNLVTRDQFAMQSVASSAVTTTRYNSSTPLVLSGVPTALTAGYAFQSSLLNRGFVGLNSANVTTLTGNGAVLVEGPSSAQLKSATSTITADPGAIQLTVTGSGVIVVTGVQDYFDQSAAAGLSPGTLYTVQGALYIAQ